MKSNNAINVFPSNRNVVIGGDLSANPWQLGTSFNYPFFGDTADMFYYGITGLGGTGRVITTKATDSPTVQESNVLTQHCLSTEVTTTDPNMGQNDQYVVVYRMEGYDWAQLAQKTITCSFWVKSSLTGAYCISLINSGSDRSFVQEYSINTANTWEKKIIQIPPSPKSGTWNYTNGVGIYFRWSLGGGSDSQIAPGIWQNADGSHSASQVNFMATLGNTFKVNLLQIEDGFTATPFETVTQADTLKRCQRYLFKTYNVNVLPGSSTTSGAVGSYVVAPTSQLLTSNLMEPLNSMRTMPTITSYSTTGSSGMVRNLTTGTDESVIGFATSTESSLGYPVMSANLTDDNLYANHILASAVL